MRSSGSDTLADIASILVFLAKDLWVSSHRYFQEYTTNDDLFFYSYLWFIISLISLDHQHRVQLPKKALRVCSIIFQRVPWHDQSNISYYILEVKQFYIVFIS